jgi:hypothetical protein
MTWLWFFGPLVTGLVYVLTGLRDKRRDAEVDRWQKQMSTPPRRMTSLPGPLARALATTGGGEAIGYFELVPRLAYLAVMGADAMQGSDHQTVLAKLDEPSPTFTVRPLPIIEGDRVPNTGVQFKKDDDFMGLFLVERGLEGALPAPASEALDKEIRKWLSPPVREALLDLPESWLRVDGKTKVMAFTVYGPTSADRIQEVIAAADIVFAEYGADGGPSLLGDDDEEEDEAPKAPKADAPKADAPKADAPKAGAPKASAAARKKKPGSAKPADKR